MQNATLSGLDGMAPIWQWPGALWKFLRSLFVSIFLTEHPTPEEMNQQVFDENARGCGVAIVLHGFKARRKFFHRKLKMIRESLGGRYRQVYAPDLRYEHNGCIYESHLHVLDCIKFFCDVYKGEPVLLIGISAGGRLAMRYAADLQTLLNPVHVVTLASPLSGTSVIYVAPWFAKIVCGEECAEEFHPESLRQERMADAMRDTPAHHSFHHFYSSADWIVFPPHRCVGPGTHQSLGPHPHAHVQTHPAFLEYIAELRMEPAAIPEID